MHFFILPNLINAQEAPNSRFSGLECVPPGAITIDEFEDSKGRKDWKIVIGRDFKYKGLKPSTGTWKWSIGGASKWNTTFTPKTAATKENEGIGIIPLTEMPTSNSDFGPTRGKVEVSNALSEKGDADVKVFYLKDDDKNNPAKVPNWFYYWSQSNEVQSILTIPGIKLYDKNNCVWNSTPTPIKLSIEYKKTPLYNSTPNANNEYGSSSFNIINMESKDLKVICGAPIEEIVVVDYEFYFAKVIIQNACGYTKSLKDGTILEGIHVMYSTIIHEVEHAKIECEVWKDGYSNLLDTDGDGYNDDWERANASKGFKIAPAKDKPPFDAYGVDPNTGTPITYNSTLLGTASGLYSVGTEYEEDRCRTEEVNSKHLFKMIDKDDWSFDPTNSFQGKQWK